MDVTGTSGFQMTPLVYISFFGYLFILFGIGIYSMKFSSGGVEEFFLGGRKMNRLVVALSAVVSGRSSWLLLGVTGMAYKMGAAAIWAVVGYTVVEFLLFIFVAPKLRRESADLNAITIPDYLAEKFKNSGRQIRWISSLIIVLFMTAYISAQFLGGGKTFAASFQISQTTGIWITAGVVLLYTVLGGFLAVSLTDLIQAFFMIFGLVILPVWIGIREGGFFFFLQKLMQTSPSHPDPFALSAGAFLGFLGIGLGSPGNPHILVRYMSIEKEKELKFSAFIGTFWNVVMGWSAVFIGMMGRALLPDVKSLPHQDPENIFPFLSHLYLHPVLFGIIIAAILAAIMSTADSMLLVIVSSIIRDIYQKILKSGQTIPQKKLVIFSRVIIVAVVIIAVILGFIADKVIFWLVLFAWGGLGAAFGPAIIMTLFYEKTTPKGIMAGMLTGVVTVIIWKSIPFLKGLIYELIPAFFLAALVIFLVSRLGKRVEI